jgi:lysophospholipase L1-like esterase
VTLRRKLVFAVTASAAGLAVVFLVGELYFHTLDVAVDLEMLTELVERPNPISVWAVADAFCGYRPRPGVYPLAEGMEKTVNEHGFMSTPPLEVEKPPEMIRIAFLGGSSTAGTGHNLSDPDTWPWRAVEELRRRLPAVELELINAAVGGYTSFESHGRLANRVRFFSPDIVVVYHGWNELSYFRTDAIDRLYAHRTLPDGSWSVERWRASYRMYEPLAIDRWIDWSQVLSHLRLRLTRPISGVVGAPVRQAEPTLAGEWDRRGLDVWRTNLQLIRETTELLGAELLVARQATLIVPELAAEHRARCGLQLHGFDFEAHLEAFEAIYRVINEEIDSDRIIDATVLSGRPELFADEVHPTVEGSDRIALLMADALEPWVQRRAAASRS